VVGVITAPQFIIFSFFICFYFSGLMKKPLIYALNIVPCYQQQNVHQINPAHRKKSCKYSRNSLSLEKMLTFTAL